MDANHLVARRSMLPGLLGIAAAALLWWFGDAWRSERGTVDQQVATTQRLLRSDVGADERAVLEQRKLDLRQARLKWHERLVDDDDLQLVRARMFYDLRQRCYEVKLNCLIRLTEVEASDKGKNGALTRSDVEDPLSKLGVSRVRATISGLLGEQDLGDVLATFTQDERRVWRFNRVQIKGRAFEVDVERHVMATKDGK